MWYLILFSSLFINSLALIIEKKLFMTSKINPAMIVLPFQILTGALITAFGIFYTGLDFSNFQQYIPNIVMMA
jgi:hypothetical protein